MDKMNVKTSGGILSIAILLITGRAKAAGLQINSASIYIGIGSFFQLLLEAVNFQLNKLTWFSLKLNTAVFSLLTGNLVINTNPVSAVINGDNIAGKGLNSNFPVTNSPGTNVQQPVVISGLTSISYFQQRFT